MRLPAARVQRSALRAWAAAVLQAAGGGHSCYGHLCGSAGVSICSFPVAAGHQHLPDCAERRTLDSHRSAACRGKPLAFASAKVILEGPSPLLTVIIGEAAMLIMSTMNIAAWLSAAASMDTSRLAAEMLQQCQALLANHKVAPQLKEQQQYPQCTLPPRRPVAVAAQLAMLANSASYIVIDHISQTFSRSESGFLIEMLTDCQQELIALSSAVALPPPHARISGRGEGVHSTPYGIRRVPCGWQTSQNSLLQQ